ncbi:MAG: bifunctional phosphopantothenoylcysteine decarboxylase/phosphopantothenate--cysteine ligase CoaBC, partial [Alphaproteobacteria bacterium]
MANAKDPAASPPVAPRATLDGVRVLLIISGGIAAYKSLELIRRLRDVGVAVQPVLTAGGARFITALAAASLAGTKCYTELFSLTDEAEMGHIRLARDCDLIIVAPASAHMMARMAAGMADDLATTVLLASDRPVLVAPAMNEVMWAAAATQDNLATLESRGVAVVGPGSGDLACGEVGSGRMAEVPVIIAAAAELLGGAARGPLAGLTALVTSGPTIEAVDPVRYIANRSSGRQGHAVAAALARLGARTT